MYVSISILKLLCLSVYENKFYLISIHLKFVQRVYVQTAHLEKKKNLQILNGVQRCQ